MIFEGGQDKDEYEGGEYEGGEYEGGEYEGGEYESGEYEGARGDEGAGEGEGDEEGPDAPWPLTLGSLSKRDLEDALHARQAYHDSIEAIARRAGKKVSFVFKAIGDLPKSARDLNPWNAFQAKYRIECPKPQGSKSFFRNSYASFSQFLQ